MDRFPSAPNKTVECLSGSGPQFTCAILLQSNTAPVVYSLPNFVVDPSGSAIPGGTPQRPYPYRPILCGEYGCDEIAWQAIPFGEHLPVFCAYGRGVPCRSGWSTYPDCTLLTYG